MYVIYIIPMLITLIGFLMYKRPPKKVNWFVGYRTRKSMKNEKVWEKANRYCGKLWIIIGLIMIIVTILLNIIVYFKKILFSETILGIIVLCEIIPLLLSGLMVESKINNKKTT